MKNMLWIGIGVIVLVAVVLAGFRFLSLPETVLGLNPGTATTTVATTTATAGADVIFSTTTPAYSAESTAPAGGDASDAAQYTAAQQAAFIASAQKAYDTYQAQSPTPPYPWVPYAIVLKYERFQSSGYVSYLVNNYQYTGGANGIQMVSTFTHAPDNHAISLADIVPSAKRAALMTALKAKLDDVDGIAAGDTSTFSDAINALTFADLKSFYLDNDTLVVVFNEYDVGPGAAGAIRVSLPLAQFALL